MRLLAGTTALVLGLVVALPLPAWAAAPAQRAALPGAGSFNEAPVAAPGSYRDVVGEGETVYYALDLDAGDGALVSATIAGRPGGPSISEAEFGLQLFDGARQPLSGPPVTASFSGQADRRVEAYAYAGGPQERAKVYAVLTLVSDDDALGASRDGDDDPLVEAYEVALDIEVSPGAPGGGAVADEPRPARPGTVEPPPADGPAPRARGALLVTIVRAALVSFVLGSAAGCAFVLRQTGQAPAALWRRSRQDDRGRLGRRAERLS